MSDRPSEAAPNIPTRKIMITVPLRLSKPYRILAEFQLLEAGKARLHYEEQFIEADRGGMQVTVGALEKVFDIPGAPKPKFYHDEDKLIIGMDAEGNPAAVAAFAMSEFLIQMFSDEDASWEFWNLVDRLQHTLSPSIQRDIWKEMPKARPPPLLLVLCGKCSKTYNVSSTLNRDFTCPFCGHKPAPPTVEDSKAMLETMGKFPGAEKILEKVAKVTEAIAEGQT